MFDRLIKIEQGADVIENAYTADGRKLSRTTNGVLTYYVYDGNVVIEEQNEDNDETARNVYGRNLITRETSDGVVVYAYNGHGDVVVICNLDNETLVIYDYDEFGNVTSETDVDEEFANFDNPYRYAGYEYIEEVKLYDLNARYYNPEIARFLSPDPYYNLGNRVIGLYEINVPSAASIMQANNIYAYCGNNPIEYCDSNGQFVQVLEWFLYSPVVQQGLQYLSNSASYAWTSISSFVAQNWHVVQQAVYETSLYGPAIIDGINSWINSGYGNQVEQAVSEASSKNNKSPNNNSNNSNSNSNNTSNSSNSHNPKDPKNWNKDSVKVNSKELYNNKNVRIDVENPNPGQRPGQVHLQISEGANKGKYIFDNVSRQFYDTSTGEVASKNIQKYLENPDILSAIDKGLTKYLGVSGIK